MKKIKKFSKEYLIGFFIGLFLFTVVGVKAAAVFPSNQTTYNNGTTGMKATNVQTAIDELYNICFPPKAGDTITDLLPSNSDELYKDDKGNIRYYGANPNNYISFNNELWRIIGVIDGKIKIIRNESIGEMQWNGLQIRNDWANSSLKKYLNQDYYNSIDEAYKKMISEETFYAGAPIDGEYSDATASKFYHDEKVKRGYTYQTLSIMQNIGLISPSDYGYAAGESCLSTALYDYDGGCKNSNYLFSGYDEWTQSAFVSATSSAFILSKKGAIYGREEVNYSNNVRPVLYLSSELQITGGNGSQSNPFVIE